MRLLTKKVTGSLDRGSESFRALRQYATVNHESDWLSTQRARKRAVRQYATVSQESDGLSKRRARKQAVRQSSSGSNCKLRKSRRPGNRPRDDWGGGDTMAAMIKLGDSVLTQYASKHVSLQLC